MAECVGDFRTLAIEWCTVHDCAEQSCTIRQLEASLVSMRTALQGMSELCGNYFDESQLVCDRDREIWAAMLKALALDGA